MNKVVKRMLTDVVVVGGAFLIIILLAFTLVKFELARWIFLGIIILFILVWWWIDAEERSRYER